MVRAPIMTLSRTTNVQALAHYVVVGDNKDGTFRAVSLAMSSCTGTNDWRQWAEETQAASLNNKGQNKNTGIHLIVSFHPDELDKDNPRDIELAQFYAGQLVKRIAPNSPELRGVHTDGRSGAVHVHCIIGNHSYDTDRPLPERASNWHHVKRENDQLARDMGMKPVEREPISLMAHEVRAKNGGREIRAYDDAGQPTAITPDTWADHLRARAERAIADPRATDMDALAAIAPEHGVEMRTKGTGTKAAITWGLLDERGETHRVKITRKNGQEKEINAAAPGKRLGTDYTLEQVQRQIAQRAQEQQQHDQLQAAQAAVYDEMEAYGLDLERITADNGTTSTTTGPGTAEPAPGAPGAAGDAGDGGTDAGGSDANTGAAGDAGDDAEPIRGDDAGRGQGNDATVFGGGGHTATPEHGAVGGVGPTAQGPDGAGAPDPGGNGGGVAQPAAAGAGDAGEQRSPVAGSGGADRGGPAVARPAHGTDRQAQDDERRRRQLEAIRRQAQERTDKRRSRDHEPEF